MLMRNKLPSDGRVLFRWRSFIPLLLYIPGAFVIIPGPELEQVYGEDVETLWVLGCVLVSMTGLAIRWITHGYIPTGTSGRNTQRMRADVLNTTGMYSVCRNPLYLGNFLAVFGTVLAFQSAWLAVISILAYWLYIERVIAAEEEFLAEKYGDEYQQWAARTPAFLPRFSLWSKPDLSFSFRTVLKREYSGVFGLFMAFYCFELYTDVFLEHTPFSDWVRSDWIWSVLMLVGLLGFIVLRILKKHTRVLKVEGR
jgi:protein-S-isoprenylcysteine O-methyltransferase Ste14